MRIAPLLLLGLVSIVLIAAQRPASVTANDEQDLTPASELALLMREMAAHADSVKAGLNRGDRQLPPYPAGVSKLLTATPTKDMHIDPITFPTFGKDYQAKVKALYKAPLKQRAQAYNALVLSCANCHSTHCPGPMMRIKKMYVKLEG
ncbi:MAG: hypothetical protein IPJ85_00395 [Flavobacteriales bacterium]|nr:hypothetical protein [Flavobacteriales bacterium]